MIPSPLVVLTLLLGWLAAAGVDAIVTKPVAERERFRANFRRLDAPRTHVLDARRYLSWAQHRVYDPVRRPGTLTPAEPSPRGQRAPLSAPLGSRFEISLGSDTRTLHLIGGEIAARGTRFAAEQSLFTLSRLRLFDRWVIEGAVRGGARTYPGATTTDTQLLGALRFASSLVVSEGHTLRASYGASIRNGALLDLFGVAEVPVLLAGNPSLHAEKVASAEAGYDLRLQQPDVAVFQAHGAADGHQPRAIRSRA